MAVLCCAVAVLCCGCDVLCYGCAVAVLIDLPSLTLNSPQICTDNATCSAVDTATSGRVILSGFNLFATLRQHLRHLRFPQQYCWCLKSSGMWLCLYYLVLKMKTFWTFEISNTPVPVTWRHLAENLTVQDKRPFGFNVWRRFVNNSYQLFWGCYGRFGKKLLLV